MSRDVIAHDVKAPIQPCFFSVLTFLGALDTVKPTNAVVCKVQNIQSLSLISFENFLLAHSHISCVLQ